jgi:hypothetical protein
MQPLALAAAAPPAAPMPIALALSDAADEVGLLHLGEDR